MSEQTSEPPEPQAASPQLPAEMTPLAAGSDAAGSETAPFAPPPAGEAPLAPVPGARGRLPRWLPAFGLAVIPALIVGLVVFALGGGDSGGGGAGAAGIIDGFLRLGPDDTSNIQSFSKALPAGFPADLPSYSGARLVVSFAIRSSTQGANFFAIFTSADPPDKVLAFFQERLGRDPWQIEQAQSSGDTSVLSFSKPADPDIRGNISAHRSDLDRKTTLFISVEDVSTAARRNIPEKAPFVLEQSLVLPPGFPNDVPIFKGKEASTVTQTYFQRGSGSVNYVVSFLTKESQDDVIGFYRKEFEKRGWQVTDSRSVSRFALGIDFQDSSRQEVQGSVRADVFADDSAYTKVDLLLQVSVRRGRGN